MSISTTRTIKELDRQCRELSIELPYTETKLGKTDYILALRKYYMDQLYGNNIPKTLSAILNIDSPMLCQRMNYLQPDIQNSLWLSKDWIAETKLDGVRFMLVKFNNDWQYYSRNISVKDFLPVSYAGNILEDWDKEKIPYDFILDCELTSLDDSISTEMESRGVVTVAQLQAITALLALNAHDSLNIQKKLKSQEGRPVIQFNCFDCLYYKDNWLLNRPLVERKIEMLKVFEDLKKSGMQIELPYSAYTNKKQFYKAVVAQGGEGIVLKNLYSKYSTANNRLSDGWVKVKRSMSESSVMTGLGDTIDAYITGFEPADENKAWAGLVGALQFSVILKKEDGTETNHVIANIASLPLELRKEITETVDGKPTLKQEWYGKVAEIDGQAVSGRAKALKHARLIKWRPDKSPDACMMTESFLNSMIL